ncbi:MAG: D-aminoacyl-tRNA deacylase [Flavobacteriales bacterium]|nr:D-aminoacyl-tRNA deacylase [Flavobacteriales bacterium]
MRVVIQRVSRAEVRIDGAVSGAIDAGFCVLVGIEDEDSQEDADWLAAKIAKLRVFNDGEGKMNADLADVGGRVLVVSQFTLHAKTKKVTRPSFIRAARPEHAVPLYEYFVQACERETGKPVATGEFGAAMEVDLVNDGPVTIWIDTKDKD